MKQPKDLTNYPASLGTTTNYHKNGVLLAYISNKIPNIHLRRLLKIIYAVKNNAFHEFVSLKRDENGKCIINSVQPHEFLIYKEMGEFSQSEIAAIDKLIAEFKNKSADDLSDITHVSTSIWSKVVAQDHISFETQKTSHFQVPLPMLFEEGDYRLAVFEDAQWNMEYQAMLNENRATRNVSTR